MIDWEDKEALDKGFDCPCCGELVKRYKRSLNHGMAKALIAIHRHTEREQPSDGWIHIANEMKSVISINDEYSKLRYWGLLEDEMVDGEFRTGRWRLTPSGRAFVTGHHAVPMFARVLFSECDEVNGPLIRIVDALKNHFDYEELMAA